MTDLLITPEMVERARARITANYDHSPVERTPAHPVLKARLQAKGLEYSLPAGPLPVVMEDDFVHTVAFPVCNDPACCCYALEREQIVAETTKRKRPRRRSYAVNHEPTRPSADTLTFMQQVMR